MKEKEHKLKKVIAASLGIDISRVHDGLSYQSIPEWNSLQHIRLVLDLSKHFDINISSKDLSKLNNVLKIKEFLGLTTNKSDTQTSSALPGVQRGLNNVAYDYSSISHIRGLEGTLSYRGYNVEDLANLTSFEEVVFLLFHRHLPEAKELVRLKAILLQEVFTRIHFNVLLQFIDNIKELSTYDFLLAFLSSFSLFQKEHDEDEITQKYSILVQIPLALGIRRLILHKQEINQLRAHSYASFAEYSLFMLTGQKLPEDVDIFNKILILHADHGSNASTFAGRVTASTQNSLRHGLITALACFGGSLHGGAVAQVMNMIQEAEKAPDLAVYLADRQQNRLPIFGFGHRVYKTFDPRAKMMRRIAEERAKQDLRVASLFSLTKKIEHYMFYYSDLGINPNVDLYVPLIYTSLGIEEENFMSSFIIGRLAGWMAHIFEQKSNNILIRPRLIYNGEEDRFFV